MHEKNGLRKPSRIFFTWLLSYLAVLVLYIALIAVSYSSNASSLKQEISRSNDIILSKMQGDFDNMLSNAIRIVVEFTFEDQLSQAIMLYESNPQENYYYLYELSQKFSKYSFYNSDISDVFIYVNSIDRIISGYTIMEPKRFYDIYVQPGEDDGYEEWLNVVSRNNGTINARTPGGDTSTLYITRGLPMIQNQTANISLVLTVNSGNMLKRIHESENWGEIIDLAILDSEFNQLVSFKNTGFIAGIDREKFRSGERFLEEDYNAERVILAHASSRIDHILFNYAVAISYDSFWASLNTNQLVMLFGLAIFIVLGAIICALILRKNYVPLSRMVKLVSDRYGLPFEQRNELDYLRYAMDRLEYAKSQADITLAQQNKRLMAFTLSRLLRGRADNRGLSVQKALESNGITLLSQSYLVLLIYIEDLSELLLVDEGGQELSGYDKFEHLVYIVADVMDGILRRTGNQSYIVNIDGQIGGIVSFAPQSLPHWERIIRESIAQAGQFFAEQLKIHVSVVASGLSDAPAELHKTYVQAMETLEYKKLFDIEGDVIFYDELSDTPGGQRYYYSLEEERRLINQIKTGDYTKAYALFEDIFEKNIASLGRGLQEVRFFIVDLYCTMTKAMNEIGGGERPGTGMYADAVKDIINFENIADMKNGILRLLEKLCAQVTADRQINRKEEDLVREILAYVEQHYTDPCLDVTRIAAAFDKNIATVSRIFKTNTGSGLLEHINSLRCAHARELLAQGLDMENVFERAGFSNLRTFMRVFKRMEGTTPGRYRKGAEA